MKETYKGHKIEIREEINDITYPYKIIIDDDDDYGRSPSIVNAIDLAKEFINNKNKLNK